MKRPILLLLIVHCQLSILNSAWAQTTYVNPVYDWDTPDPSVQRAQDGTFYCYATACQTRKSQDLVHWTNVNNVFDRPTWNDTTYVKDGRQQTDYYSVWAADVNYVDGRYLMYYALALWGNGSRTGIGVATATTPYRFTDVGRLFRSTEIKVENSIDPVYIEEWDKKYLAWGSFNGIYIAELTDDGLQVRDKSKIKKIAGTAFEGAMIHKHGNHYYLFASIGACCEGLRSTYQTVVGRSTNLTGPYISRSGQLMTNNGYTLLLSKNSKWVGPGHNSEVLTDDEGQDWLLYHAYDASDESKGRVLLLDRLKWDSAGWPYIEGGTPSTTEQPAPVFHKGDGARMDYRLANADFQKSNLAGWTLRKADEAVAESGLGTAFLPLMHAAAGSFSIEQTCSGLPDGLYEVSLQGFATQGHAQLRVGSVLTPLADARTLPDAPPTAAADLSRRMLDGQYAQSAYGLVVGGKLTLGLQGDLEPDEHVWLGNLRLTRREANEAAGLAVSPWYLQRIQEVLQSPNIDDYYKTRLAAYRDQLEAATTADERYSALLNIHKQLDRLGAAEPLYDAVGPIIAPAQPQASAYDLSGRPAPDGRARRRGILLTKGKKIAVK